MSSFRSRTVPVLLLLSAAGCRDKNGADSGVGTVRSPAEAFPTAELMVGGQLDLAVAALPQAQGGTPLPTDRVAWRQGFSPVQTTVLDVGVAVDPASLPDRATGWEDGGSAEIWDLDTGTRIPAWAEVDAYPDNDEVPVVLVRPQIPMPVGHRVAVVLTTQAWDTDGDALAQVPWFADAAAGVPGEGIDPDHYPDLIDALEQASGGALTADTIAIAVDFPIGDGTAPMRSVAAQVPLPTEWTWDHVKDADEDEGLPEGVWRLLEGRFTSTTWLQDDDAFAVDADGMPVAQGDDSVHLYVMIPDTVRDAEPGTVPVWLFGHGIFSQPENYLGDPDDPSGVIDLARGAGAIVIGTRWRGLTYTDLAVAVQVGNDFGRLPELTDKLIQGVADTLALNRLATEGALLDDPYFDGLPRDGGLGYYGISLGGIEGAVTFANQDALAVPLEHGVLHVGGSAWSTMLERSSNWTQFETLMEFGVPSPRDRQLMYAASQLLWDAADPALYADALADQSLLWQISMGDEQVPNMTTNLLLRGVGAPLLEPAAAAVDGLDTGAFPTTGPAGVQFDPQLGAPAQENRPAEVSGAHQAPRLWEGTKAQTRRFLDADDPGIIEHYCGELVCSADNPG